MVKRGERNRHAQFTLIKVKREVISSQKSEKNKKGLPKNGKEHLGDWQEDLGFV